MNIIKYLKKILANNVVMIKYICKYCPSQIAITFLLSILMNFSSIIGIFYTKFIIDSVTKGENFSVILAVALFILILNSSISLINTWVSQYISPKNVQKLSRGMSNELFRKAATIDFSLYEDTNYYNNFTMAMQQSDTRALEILETCTSFFSSIISIMSFSLIITVFDPLLFIIVFLMVITNIIFLLINTKLQRQYYKDKLKPSREAGYAQRVFYLYNYAKELRMYPELARLILEYFNNAIQKVICIVNNYAKKITYRSCCQNIVSNIINIFATLYLAYKVFYKILKVSDYYALLASIGQLTSKITSLAQILPQLYEHSLYVDDFLNFVSYKSENEKRIGNNVESNGDIVAKHIYFNYPNSKKIVLKDISFEIMQGEKVAFVGENGSGKSTIVKLLVRLYDINEGEILFNSHSICDYDIDSYRNSIGVVLQDFQILSISIAENILMRPIINKETDEQIVYKALEKVNLLERVKKLPNGIYTNISNEYDVEGIFLSGGELQLLAIARIFAKKSNIIILDEPSSSLDALMENKIIDLILKNANNKTIILISHRLTNVKDVDQIFYIENGHIIEHGKHQDLMKLNKKYANMFETQAQNYY